MDTYEVVLHAESPGPVLLQQPLQQLAPSVRHVRLQHQRLVEDVVVHLSCVTTVERRLEREREVIRTEVCQAFIKTFSVISLLISGNKWILNAIKFILCSLFYSPVHTASHTGPTQGTTSPLCGHRPVSGGPLVPNTVETNIHQAKMYWFKYTILPKLV